MNYRRIKKITMAHLDFYSITSKGTNNLVAETMVPEFLIEAIRAGVEVVLTDPSGQEACRLGLNDKGSFQFYALT